MFPPTVYCNVGMTVLVFCFCVSRIVKFVMNSNMQGMCCPTCHLLFEVGVINKHYHEQELTRITFLINLDNISIR